MSSTQTLTWLSSPEPRSVPLRHTPLVWQTTDVVALPPAKEGPLPPLDDVLAHRRSTRAFTSPCLSDLASLLWQVNRTLNTAVSPMGFQIERRPIPSAGAIHPVHILVEQEDAKGWALYDAQQHVLRTLNVPSHVLAPLVELCEQVVPRGDGRLMLFAAEFGKTAAKYRYPESLVWRDAGVLQGALTLTATALGMSFCLLGITGNPWIGDLADQGQLMGVGAAIFGSTA